MTFEVSEFEPAYPVRFEGIQASEASLKAFLQSRDPLFGEKLPATTAVVDRYAKAIQEFAASQGQNEKIVGRITPTGPDQFVIVFRPDRALPSVAQVSFEGNQVIPSPALQERVSSAAIGSVYTEGRFREILDASVRPLYETRGRIRVSFPKITVADAKDVKGLLVKVVIEEGPSFDLGDVRVEGNSGVKAEDLLRAADFKTGDLANFEEISKGMQRLRKTLQRNGFMRAEAELERRINDQKKVVDLIVRVREGPQFTFSKLIIQGLDIHAEAAIKKLWALKEGKALQRRLSGLFPEPGARRWVLRKPEKDQLQDRSPRELEYRGCDAVVSVSSHIVAMLFLA